MQPNASSASAAVPHDPMGPSDLANDPAPAYMAGRPVKKEKPFAERALAQLQILIAICCFSGFGVLTRLAFVKISKKGRPDTPDYDVWGTIPGNPTQFEGSASAFMTSNLLGTFIIGFFSLVPDDLKYKLHVGVTVGFCGSLTTFSSFICEAIQANKNAPNSFGLVMTKIVNTMCVCFCAWLAGRFVAQTLINLKLHKPFMNDDVLQGRLVADDAPSISNMNAASSSNKKIKKDEKLKFNLEMVLWITMIAVWLTVMICGIALGKTWKDAKFNYDLGMSVLFGFGGAYLRYWLSVSLNPSKHGFFTGTFVANMLATLILICMKRYDSDGHWKSWGYAISNGFCASLSTVSSFINDIFKGFKRAEDEHATAARTQSLSGFGKETTVEGYAAGYWSAWSPVVYMFATLGIGGAIVSCFAFT